MNPIRNFCYKMAANTTFSNAVPAPSAASGGGGGRIDRAKFGPEVPNTLVGSNVFKDMNALYEYDSYKGQMMKHKVYEVFPGEGKPRHLEDMTSLIIPRKGKDNDEFPQVIVAGTCLTAAQMALYKIRRSDLPDLCKFWQRHTGASFDVSRFLELLGDKDEMDLPFLIEAVPEGLKIERGTALFRVTAVPVNGKTHAWLVPVFLERIQRGGWFSCTVATKVAAYKNDLYHWVKHTLPPAQQKFQASINAWDFGDRGGAVDQVSPVAGLAILQAGVGGSDTLPAIRLAELFRPDYVRDAEGNIKHDPDGEPELQTVAFGTELALEHAVMLQGGTQKRSVEGLDEENAARIRAEDAAANLQSELDVFFRLRARVKDGVFAVVIDSSDPEEFLNRVTRDGRERELCIRLHKEAAARGSFTKTTFRPDSCVVLKEDSTWGKKGTKLSHGDTILYLVELWRKNLSDLPKEDQFFENSMGFWEAPGWSGIIYGDSLKRKDTCKIRDKMWAARYAAFPLFGIGGNWHCNDVTRGTLDFAAKPCDYLFTSPDGSMERVVCSKSISSKVSPLGPQKVIRRIDPQDGVEKIIMVPVGDGPEEDIMIPIYDGTDGKAKLYNRPTLNEVRATTERAMGWTLGGAAEPMTFEEWKATQPALVKAEADEFAQAEAELMAARDKLAALQSARMVKRMPPLPASDEEGGGATPGLMMCGGGGGGDATPMLASMEEGCATPKLHDARINAACSYAQLQLAQAAHQEATQRLEKAQEAHAWAASGLRATEEFVARR